LKVNDALSGAGLAALGGAVLWHIQGFPAMPGQKFGPAWFPGLIAAGLLVCGVLLMLHATRGPWLARPEWTTRARPLAGVAAVIGGLLFYVAAADWLGFHLTGLLLLTLWTRVLGAGWRLSLAVSVIATLAIHLSFYKLMRIPLPWGLLEHFAF
jgi:putative tricarboxylic transport membrane protein